MTDMISKEYILVLMMKSYAMPPGQEKGCSQAYLLLM